MGDERDYCYIIGITKGVRVYMESTLFLFFFSFFIIRREFVFTFQTFMCVYFFYVVEIIHSKAVYQQKTRITCIFYGVPLFFSWICLFFLYFFPGRVH